MQMKTNLLQSATQSGTAFRTYGLSHLALAVKSLDRSIQFYQQVFGMEVMYAKEHWAQLNTPGTNDIIVLEEHKLAGKTGGGIMHFGFRLIHPGDIEKAKQALKAAGAEITSSGEFVPGEPYLFCKDPDGYEIEIWYESLDV